MFRIVFLAFLPIVVSSIAISDEPTDDKVASTSSAGDDTNREPQGPIAPLTVARANEIFNARQFPTQGGDAAGNYSSPTRASYVIYDKFDRVYESTRQTFKKLGWREVHVYDSAEGAVGMILTDGQIFVSCSVSSPNKESVIVYMSVFGNFDLRDFPKHGVGTVKYDKPDLQMYESTLSSAEVIAAYTKVLVDQGWQPYETFGFAAIETRREARFRNHGVTLLVVADGEEKCDVIMTASMLATDIPTPPSARGIKLDDSEFLQTFRSTESVPRLAAFFRTELMAAGWRMVEGRTWKDEAAAMFITHPEYDSRCLEILRQPGDVTTVFMGRLTRQLTRAFKTPREFEVKYETSKPLAETRMHSLHYQSIPFFEAKLEGSGRTIAESLFFNTSKTQEEIFGFYRSYFSKIGWDVGDRQNDFIGEKLNRATMAFTLADAEIQLATREWGEDVVRVTIEGNGIQFPGNRFCHMLARGESNIMDWSFLTESEASERDNETGVTE